MAKRKSQQEFFKRSSPEYGGTLRTTRQSRATPRPPSTRTTMFVTLKSTQAVGRWAFNHPANRARVEAIVHKFAKRFAVKIHSIGNAGNHVHLHLKLANRHLYRGFIRALSAALAFAVTGHSRWNKVLQKKVFDHRPHTRVVPAGRAPFRNVEEYNFVNDLEGKGLTRAVAEIFAKYWRGARASALSRLRRENALVLTSA